MTKVSEIINKVKSESGVDDFDIKLNSEINNLILDIINDIREYSITDDDGGVKNKNIGWCRFCQEVIANELEKKYL